MRRLARAAIARGHAPGRVLGLVLGLVLGGGLSGGLFGPFARAQSDDGPFLPAGDPEPGFELSLVAVREGPLERAAVVPLLDAARAGIQRCAEVRSRARETLDADQVHLHLLVSPAGRVTTVELPEAWPDEAPPHTRWLRCAARPLRRLRFPPAEVGSRLQLNLVWLRDTRSVAEDGL